MKLSLHCCNFDHLRQSGRAGGMACRPTAAWRASTAAAVLLAAAAALAGGTGNNEQNQQDDVQVEVLDVLTTSDSQNPELGEKVMRGQVIYSQANPEAGGDVKIPQLPGFPKIIDIAPFGWSGIPARHAVALADFTGDGNLEVMASSSLGIIHVWEADGEYAPGFPITDILGVAQPAPAVGDLNGDGFPDIVQATRNDEDDEPGGLYAFNHLGQPLPGFPISFDGHWMERPTLYDLDDDGTMEIIVAERDDAGTPGDAGDDLGFLHIINHDGASWGGNWPLQLDTFGAVASPAVADLNNDGAVEIVHLSYGSLYVLATNGESLPGWPKDNGIGAYSYQSPALANIDDDPELEIIVAQHAEGQYGGDGYVVCGTYIYNLDGTLVDGWPQIAGGNSWTFSCPTVTDLTGDGAWEILSGRLGVINLETPGMYAWDSNGNDLSGFPFITPTGGTEGPYLTADVDGDGDMEIFFGGMAASNINGGFVYGVDHLGNELPGFPLRPEGFTARYGIQIGDLTDDGDYELAVISWRYFNGPQTVAVNVYDLPGEYAVNGFEWLTYHLRNIRGGWYAPAAPCPADVSGDGQVTSADLNTLLANFAGSGSGDIDGDGAVDSSDLNLLLSSFGTSCP